MAISIFTVFAVVLCALAVCAVGASPALRRRLRRPRLVQGVAIGAAVALVPLNVWCALGHGGGGHGGVLALCVELGTLTALSAIAALVMTLWIQRVPSRHPRRVLAIGAHPDDLELGCGGAMAKMADSGHEVHALVMTNGERGGDRGVRPGEAQNGARFIGAAGVEVLDFTDTWLSASELEMVHAIEDAIQRFNPDIVFTHSANDQHQDHLAVHRATLRAARRHSAVLCYESPSATSAFRPSVFVDIDGYVDVKTAAVSAHRDQSSKPYMDPERVKGLAVFRGDQAKVRHAEGYEPVRLLSSPLGEL